MTPASPGPPITVSLVGGLGNQLFTYYAGAALAHFRGVGLTVDATWAAHGASIQSFQLEGRWISPQVPALRPIWGRSSVPYRALMKGARASAYLRKRLRLYDSPEVGHDPELMQQPPGARIRGYFQSWRLVAEAIARGSPRSPRLRSESAWLRRMRQEADRQRPVMVHVRRGDYAASGFGLLGDSYYERALWELRALGLKGPVWVFSDEPERIPEQLRASCQVVSSPAGDAEDMVLMSHGAGNVIANSTFSWWGAWMNSSNVPVAYPTPWFRSGPPITGLTPPWWTAVESGWEYA